MSTIGVRQARWRPYVALMRTRARAALAYRLNFMLGTFTMMFQLIAMLAIWRITLAGSSSSSPTVLGFDWPHMKAYLLVGFVSGMLVSMFAEWSMAGRVLDGMVALDLTKPVDYQTARFAEVIGSAWAELLATFVVCAGVIALTGPIPLPSPANAAIFAVSMLTVLPLKFLVVYLTSIICFYTQNYLGVTWSRQALVGLLSGALVPLSFLPAWLETVAQLLPFASLASTPGLIFVGQVQGAAALRLVALQVVWTVLLWFGARYFFRRAVKQVTIHGG